LQGADASRRCAVESWMLKPQVFCPFLSLGLMLWLEPCLGGLTSGSSSGLRRPSPRHTRDFGCRGPCRWWPGSRGARRAAGSAHVALARLRLQRRSTVPAPRAAV